MGSLNEAQLEYRCAKMFLMGRVLCEGGLEELVSNEMHFGGEGTKELEERTGRVDWKRKGKAKGGKEDKIIIEMARCLEA
ncbi:uncharacterized protein MONOS_18240 [Monocercomonoides exilis]|uniref:uncharacterized protein n=1 Tax=Monocercomonoides exilis TaxID=2049356 RepID=UPI00355A1E91|nr:hypothetical protein MONOS_18240 [Monocercomonoides exilis]